MMMKYKLKYKAHGRRLKKAKPSKKEVRYKQDKYEWRQVRTEGNTSVIYVSSDGQYILKEVIKYRKFYVYKEEKRILNLLEKSCIEWAPKLIDFDDKSRSLILTHCGDTLSVDNAPDNWRMQIKEILYDLKRLKVSHNDIKPSEILIKNNKMYLCDFGWACINNQYLRRNRHGKKNPIDRLRKDFPDEGAIKRMGYFLENRPMLLEKGTKGMPVLEYQGEDTALPVERHLIVDWTNHFDSIDMQKMLEEHYCLNFKGLNMCEPLKNKQKAMKLFYSGKVKKNDPRGGGKFTVYVVDDSHPVYAYRPTSRGRRIVNINTFDFKQKLRDLAGDPRLVHATDNIQETKLNLRALNLFDKYYQQRKFKNLNEAFNRLASFRQCDWVVTHDFQEVFNHALDKEPFSNNDIDFLTNDYFLFLSALDCDEQPKGGVLNGVSNGGSSVRCYLHLNDKRIPIDVRHVGDNLLDIKFQENILRTSHGAGRPNDEYHLYSLIYHVTIHKPTIPENHKKTLLELGIEKENINKKYLRDALDKFMKKNDYKYTKPEPSVPYFI